MSGEDICEVSFEKRPQYVFTHLKAASAAQVLTLTFLAESAALCSEHKTRNLMLLREIPDVLTDTTAFFTAVRAAEILGKIKFAVVDRDPGHSRAMKLLEQVLTSHGVVSRSFKNEPDSEDWLLSQ